mmetsp:Transcript_5237/g.10618  ORF Transcript_5237/g.10618 Transcript_5237/m.10618 type:complete len:247 (+) Transcript_5237:75-815(+)
MFINSDANFLNSQKRTRSGRIDEPIFTKHFHGTRHVSPAQHAIHDKPSCDGDASRPRHTARQRCLGTPLRNVHIARGGGGPRRRQIRHALRIVPVARILTFLPVARGGQVLYQLFQGDAAVAGGAGRRRRATRFRLLVVAFVGVATFLPAEHLQGTRGISDVAEGLARIKPGRGPPPSPFRHDRTAFVVVRRSLRQHLSGGSESRHRVAELQVDIGKGQKGGFQAVVVRCLVGIGEGRGGRWHGIA